MHLLFALIFHCFLGLAAQNYDVEASQENQLENYHESDSKKEVLGLLQEYKIGQAPPSNKPILKLATRKEKEKTDEN